LKVEESTPLAAALRRYRHRAMLTQEVLADRAFVSVRTIRNVESGRVVPQAASLRRLAHALGLPPDEEESLALRRSAAVSSGAIALFLRLAAEAAPKRELRAEARPDVERICRCVDGLPLALELTAARLRTLSVHELADRLERDLPTGGQNPDTRQNTLELAIDWAYRLLDPSAQRLLARLAVFPREFRLESAERILAYGVLTEREILPALGSLVDNALVRAWDSPAGSHYRLPDAVRDYAEGRLREFGESRIMDAS
jgi:predicted ATPase